MYFTGKNLPNSSIGCRLLGRELGLELNTLAMDWIPEWVKSVVEVQTPNYNHCPKIRCKNNEGKITHHIKSWFFSNALIDSKPSQNIKSWVIKASVINIDIQDKAKRTRTMKFRNAHIVIWFEQSTLLKSLTVYYKITFWFSITTQSYICYSSSEYKNYL